MLRRSGGGNAGDENDPSKVDIWLNHPEFHPQSPSTPRQRRPLSPLSVFNNPSVGVSSAGKPGSTVSHSSSSSFQNRSLGDLSAAAGDYYCLPPGDFFNDPKPSPVHPLVGVSETLLALEEVVNGKKAQILSELGTVKQKIDQANSQLDRMGSDQLKTMTSSNWKNLRRVLELHEEMTHAKASIRAQIANELMDVKIEIGKLRIALQQALSEKEALQNQLQMDKKATGQKIQEFKALVAANIKLSIEAERLSEKHEKEFIALQKELEDTKRVSQQQLQQIQEQLDITAKALQSERDVNKVLQLEKEQLQTAYIEQGRKAIQLERDISDRLSRILNLLSSISSQDAEALVLQNQLKSYNNVGEGKERVEQASVGQMTQDLMTKLSLLEEKVKKGLQKEQETQQQYEALIQEKARIQQEAEHHTARLNQQIEALMQELQEVHANLQRERETRVQLEARLEAAVGQLAETKIRLEALSEELQETRASLQREKETNAARLEVIIRQLDEAQTELADNKQARLRAEQETRLAQEAKEAAEAARQQAEREAIRLQREMDNMSEDFQEAFDSAQQVAARNLIITRAAEGERDNAIGSLQRLQVDVDQALSQSMEPVSETSSKTSDDRITKARAAGSALSQSARDMGHHQHLQALASLALLKGEQEHSAPQAASSSPKRPTASSSSKRPMG